MPSPNTGSAAATLLFAVLIATMFLPPIVTLIPLYRMVGSLGLGASLAGVILPNLANAFGIFLMRQFIAGVPDDLIDAARVDGASELLILFQIVAPSIAPAIAALALFAFVYHWNSYLWPLTVLQGNSRALSDRHQPQPPAELQSRRHEHRAGDGRGDAGGAAAAGAVRAPAALLRQFDRRIGRQGLDIVVRPLLSALGHSLTVEEHCIMRRAVDVSVRHLSGARRPPRRFPNHRPSRFQPTASTICRSAAAMPI